MADVPRSILGDPQTSLKDRFNDITTAINILIQGF
ncbi:hypothetical protein [Roseobacter fucihabitans]